MLDVVHARVMGSRLEELGAVHKPNSVYLQSMASVVVLTFVLEPQQSSPRGTRNL
jgi:hypothetical protein